MEKDMRSSKESSGMELIGKHVKMDSKKTSIKQQVGERTEGTYHIFSKLVKQTVVVELDADASKVLGDQLCKYISGVLMEYELEKKGENSGL